jgi:hypothetical protein
MKAQTTRAGSESSPGPDSTDPAVLNRLVVVLYSYAKRRDRQLRLVEQCLGRIQRRGLASVCITADAGDPCADIPGVETMRLEHPSGYEHLPDKTIAMLRWLAARSGWEYVIKCDDDVLLDPAAIRILRDRAEQPDYQSTKTIVCKAGVINQGYHRGRCANAMYNERDTDVGWAGEGLPFAAGACYVLSRRAVDEVLRELDSSGFSIASARAALDMRGIGEDVLVGYLLRQRGITPVESLRLVESRSRLRGLLRHLARQAWSFWQGRDRDHLCLGALMYNRPPWPGELWVLRAWFSCCKLLHGRRRHG